MSFGAKITNASVKHYKAVTAWTVGLTLAIAAVAAGPSLVPGLAGWLHPITVDTDPENMLSPDEPIRVFHNRMKKRFGLHDMLVVGVVNEKNPQGVFNAETLKKVYELTQFAKAQHWDENGRSVGVIVKDLLAPSTVNEVHPGKVDPARPDLPAPVAFEELMPQPPADDAAALEIWKKARRVPFLYGTIVSDTEGDRPSRALALYVPITRKDLSYQVSQKLRGKIAEFSGDEKYYITGLPIAQDQFGVEMFIQMAISAPAAMVVIFVLMLVFFRKLIVIVSPMVVALISVIFTMGTLVIAGFPIHIMSSMIPIFIMPIAVLDSIHIISEFFEKYQATRDRAATIRSVMDHLFAPMLYTSLTSAAGFASLALTPIPPVQVFGIFVGAGIMVAWVLTVTFIPAFVMFIPASKLENFGAKHAAEGHGATDQTGLGRFLRWLGGAVTRRAKVVLAVSLVVLAVAGYGISRININDNPVKWFAPSHEIRVADRVLNKHFGGTYMAYLALLPKEGESGAAAALAELKTRSRAEADALAGENPAATKVFAKLVSLAEKAAGEAKSPPDFYRALEQRVQDIRSGQADGPAAPQPGRGPAGEPALPSGDEPAAPGGLPSGDEPALPGGLGAPTSPPASAPASAGLSENEKLAWRAAAVLVSDLKQAGTEIFKDPAVLRFQDELERAMLDTGIVGKTSSLASIVKTVYRDFRSGRAVDYRVPDTRQAVGQMLIQFQQQRPPRNADLWHFVTPDYRTGASTWVQLTSGDNKDMTAVAAAVDRAVAKLRAEHKDDPTHPVNRLEHKWFGLTYINVIWQEKMVTGMLQAFTGSFLVVFLLMTVLFRSALWGLLSMIPLTVTIAAIYGAIGLIGKDYDMPVAVLSSLTLGLAVDFAIHFLVRARSMYASRGSWQATAPAVFGEPARAITRNIIVIAAGFLPLLLAPLVPYKTVGVLLATILLVSGVGTLLLLPALIAVLEKRLFKPAKAPGGGTCQCAMCAVASITMVAMVALTLHQSISVGWTTLTWLSAASIPVLAVTCSLLSRRAARKHSSADSKENNHA